MDNPVEWVEAHTNAEIPFTVHIKNSMDPYVKGYQRYECKGGEHCPACAQLIEAKVAMAIAGDMKLRKWIESNGDPLARMDLQKHLEAGGDKPDMEVVEGVYWFCVDNDGGLGSEASAMLQLMSTIYPPEDDKLQEGRASVTYLELTLRSRQ